MNENQKGGVLDKDVLNDEVLASSEHVFKKGGSFGNQKGLQQHFTPEKVAKFIAAVLGSDEDVIDPTAGDGSLLQGFGKQHQFGIEIDGSQVNRGQYEAVKGDVKHVFPILRNLGELWPRVVLNPPFGLEDWADPSICNGATIGSTRLAFEYGLELVTGQGGGVIICGRDRYQRDILPEHGDKFFAVFEVEDLWEDVVLPCVVGFWVYQRRHSYGSQGVGQINRKASASELEPGNAGLIADVKAAAQAWNPFFLGSHYRGGTNDDRRIAMRAAQTEYDRRLGRRIGNRKSRYDLSIQGGILHYAPTAYARMMLEKAYRHDYLYSVNRKSVNWFVFNRQEWQRIKDIETEVDGFTIDPAMHREVEKVMEEALDSKTPLYELKPQQRLGFLPDVDLIECVKTDEQRGFKEGEKYPITCTDAERTEVEQNRPVKTDSGTELKSFRIRHKYLKITIRAERRYHNFGESVEDIEYLMEHFKLPDPGTVATRHPEEVAKYRQILLDIQNEGKGRFPYTDPDKGWVKGEPSEWKFHPFQLEDLARALVKQRVILAWEQGGGKTLGQIAWIKANFADGKRKRALIVCPQDLISQTCDEWELFVGERPTIIASWSQAGRIAKELKAGGEGIFITHYEMLSRNGTVDAALPPDWMGELYEREDGEVGVIGLMGHKWVPAQKKLDFDEQGRYVEIETEAYLHRTTAMTNCPQCGADTGASWRPPTGSRPGQCDPHRIARTEEGKDPETGRVIWTRDVHGCGYRHVGIPPKVAERKQKLIDQGQQAKANAASGHHRKKPVGSLLSTAFRGGVVVLDEITKMKGDSSGISKAVRAIRCDCILGLSGTPIKNYIYDAFWPMWYVIGNNVPRFPYDYEGKNRFSQDFSAYEWELKDDGKLGAGKPTAQVTNLMKLWPLMGASYIRRRKEEMGVEVVPRTFYPTIVPLGVAQRAQMHKWLKNFATFYENENPNSRVVLAGMHHFLAPILGLNEKLRWASILPESDKDKDYWEIPVSNWTPKNVKTLEIAMHHAAMGDRVLIGSTRIDTAEWLMNQLSEREVQVETLLEFPEDGPPKTKKPSKRAAVVKEFQAGEAQVLCSTLEAMAFGHNLDKANVVIIQALPWDYATLDQFLARVHRISSRKPVSVYVVMGKGSIDERMWQLLTEKGDSAQLALDGRLIEQDIEEIKEADVIRELMESGVPVQGDEVPEPAIEEKWQSIHSVADLGDFNRPEAQEGVMESKAEQTDATTFVAPDDTPEHRVEEYHIQELEVSLDGAVPEGADPTVSEDVREPELAEAEEGSEAEAGEPAPAGMDAEVSEFDNEPITEEEREMHRDLDRELTPYEEPVETMDDPPEGPYREIEDGEIDLDEAPDDEPAEEPKEREMVGVGAGEQSFFDFDF